MALSRTCDICGTSTDVERYSMQHKQRRGVDDGFMHGPAVSSLSMGGIDLCRDDWERIAQPRQQQYILGITDCDICGSGDKVLRLTLKQSYRDDKGRVRDRGKGSVALCVEDWKRIGLPTMRTKVDKQTDPVRTFILNAERARKG